MKRNPLKAAVQLTAFRGLRPLDVEAELLRSFEAGEDPHSFWLRCKVCSSELRFTASADPFLVEAALVEHRDGEPICAFCHPNLSGTHRVCAVHLATLLEDAKCQGFI